MVLTYVYLQHLQSQKLAQTKLFMYVYREAGKLYHD